MPAAYYDFEIEQGTTFVKIVVWKDDLGVPRNLTSCTAKLQARASKTSSDVLLDLSTPDEGLSITPLRGSIIISLSAALTAAITWKRAKYDLEVIDSAGFVTRLLQGDITISQEVTK